jgi:hypothetical protein
VTVPLHERARRIRERGIIRAWEFRQRHHSHGVWYRLRRVLADTAEAWSVAEPEADRLERAGRVPLEVGYELAPPKRMFFLTAEEIEGITDRQVLPVRLCPELLQARTLVLRAFAPRVPARTVRGVPRP